MRTLRQPLLHRDSQQLAPPKVVESSPALAVPFCTTVTERAFNGCAHSSRLSVDREGRSIWKRAISARQSRTEKVCPDVRWARESALCARSSSFSTFRISNLEASAGSRNSRGLQTDRRRLSREAALLARAKMRNRRALSAQFQAGTLQCHMGPARYRCRSEDVEEVHYDLDVLSARSPLHALANRS